MNKFLIALTTASVIGFTNVPAGDYNDSMKEGMPASGNHFAFVIVSGSSEALLGFG